MKLSSYGIALSYLLVVASGCGGGDGDGDTPAFDAAPGNADAAVAIDAAAVDDEAPAAVSDFAALSSDTAQQIDLTWTNPGEADLAGVLIVAGAGVDVDFAPTDGTAYSVDDEVAASQVVLHAALAEATSDTSVIPGVEVRYAAWAYDAALNYSPVSLSSAMNPKLGAQTATLSVDLATGDVTTVSPDHLLLTATAVYDDPGDSLTISLTTRNDTGRLLFNLKGLSTTINQGTQAGPTFPSAVGQPMTYFGDEALDVGQTATRDIVLTGIDGTVDPITVDLSFVDHPMMFFNSSARTVGWFDSSGSGQGGNAGISEAQGLRGFDITSDGRTIFVPAKDLAQIYSFDTTTLTYTASAQLSVNPLASTGSLAIVGDSVYACVNEGGHYRGTNGTESATPGTTTAFVARYDQTIAEQERVALPLTSPATCKGVYPSPDGSRAAVLVSDHRNETSFLWVLDTVTWSLVDTDAGAAGTNPVTLSANGNGYAERGIWTPDGSTFYVGFNDQNTATNANGGSLDVVDMSTFSTSQLAPTQQFRKAGLMVIVGDLLYYVSTSGGSAGGITTFDLANGSTAANFDTAIDGERSIGVLRDGSKIFTCGRQNSGNGRAQVYDGNGNAIDIDGDPDNGVDLIATLTHCRSYSLLASPF